MSWRTVLASWGALLVLFLCALASAQPAPLTVWPSPRAAEPDEEGVLRFSLVVTNTGPTEVHHVTVEDSLSPGAVFVEAQPQAERQGDALRWVLGALGPGESARVTVVVRGGADLGASARGLGGGSPLSASAPAVAVTQWTPEEREALGDPAQADPEVLAMVAALEGDPQRIEDFVRQQVGYDAYAGLLQGPRGVLWSRRGNAWDQASLLVEMLRVAGVPARYRQASLEPEAASALLRSMYAPRKDMMFPELRDPMETAQLLADPVWRAENLPADAAQALDQLDLTPARVLERLFPDPTQDPALLALAQDHCEVEARQQGAWRRLSPTGAQEAQGDFQVWAEVPQERQHRVVVRFLVELFNPLFGSALSVPEQQVLEAELPSTAWRGQPLILGVDTQHVSRPGLIFGVIENVYVPYLQLGAQRVATGEGFMELFGNFPGGTQMLLGAALEVEVHSPGEAPRIVRHQVLDRLGAQARRVGEDDVEIDLEARGLDGSPAMTDLQRVQLHLSTGATPWRAQLQGVVRQQRLKRRWEQDLGLDLRALEQQLGPEEPIPPAQMHLEAQGRAWLRDFHDAQAQALGARYLYISDRVTEVVSSYTCVHATTRSPRLMVAQVSHGVDTGTGLLGNVLLDEVTPRVRPGQADTDRGEFEGLRGYFLKVYERGALDPNGDREVISWDLLLQAAEREDVQLRLVTSDNYLDLYRLDLPADARAEMLAQLQDGRLLFFPERPLQVQGEEMFLWMTFDADTSRISISNAQGYHVAKTVYALVLNGFTALYRAVGAIIGSISGTGWGLIGGALSGLTLGAVLPKQVGANPWIGTGSALVAVIAVFLEKGFKAGSAAAAFLKGPVAAKIAGTFAFWATFGPAFTIGQTLVKRDPALRHEHPQGKIPERFFGPPHLHHGPLEAQGALLVDSPRLEGPSQQVFGVFSASWQQEAWFYGVELAATGTLEAQGLAPRQVTLARHLDAARVEGAWQMEAVGAARPVGQRLAFDLESAEATPTGEATLQFYGAVEPDPAPRLYTLRTAQAALRGTGSASLPQAGQLALESGTVVGAGVSWGQVEGTLRWDQPAQDGLVAQSKARLGLSAPRVQVARGELAQVQVQWEASQAEPWNLVALAPEGWTVTVQGQQVQVQPAAQAALGEHVLQLWAEDPVTGRAVPGLQLVVELVPDAARLSVEMEHDPFWSHYRQQDIPIPLSFPARITNHDEQRHVVDLEAVVPSGMTPILGASQLELAPGEAAEVFLTLDPASPLPAPQSALRVELRATSQGLSASDVVELGFPAVWSAQARFEPPVLRGEPGSAHQATLVLEGRGNSAGPILLQRINHSAQVSLEGLPESVTVEPGQVLELPVTATLSQEAVEGLDYRVPLRMVRPGLEPWLGDVDLTLSVIGPEANQALCAADLATELEEPEQSAAWLGVADRIQRAGFRCRDTAVYQLKRALQSLTAEMSDPAYHEVAQELRAYEAALIDEVGCQELDLEALSQIIGRAKALMEALRDHDLRVTLLPPGTFTQPGQEVTLMLQLEPLGAQPTTVSLSLEGLEGQLDSPQALAQEAQVVPVTFQVPEAGRHVITVTAQVQGAPQLTRQARAVILAQERWVEVTGAGADPMFAVPGARLELFVDLFNVLHAPFDVEAEVEVLRPDGSTLWASPAPVPLHLTTALGAQRFGLGLVETFGEEEGHYRVRVRLRQSGAVEPIPGGEGEGVVFIGQPFEVEARVVPEVLPPGDLTAQTRITLTRRDLEPLPGLGALEEYQLLSSDVEGPNGLAVDGEGNLYYSSFGTRRSSDLEGFVQGTTVNRLSPFGAIEELATVPPSPTGLALGADGALYVTNVGNPERVTRVDLLHDNEVSVWWDFEQNNPSGGGVGENPISMVFDDQGNLYVTELFEPGLFVTYPGERVYKLSPDLDNDGAADSASSFVTGFEYANHMAIDRRSQELLVSDDRQRVVRVNTVGDPEPTDLVAEAGKVQGLWMDEAGRLYVLDDEVGSLTAWPTRVEAGRVVLDGAPVWLAGGLKERYNLHGDLGGHLITADPDDDYLIRVFFAPPRAPQTLGLQVEHQTTGQLLPESALPEGALTQGALVSWSRDFVGELESERYEVTHTLEGLTPGQVVVLAQGTTLRYRADAVDWEVALPPQKAVVDHMLAAAPDRLELRRLDPQRLTVRVRNLRGEPDVWTLETLEGAPGLLTEHPQEISLEPGEEREVEVVVTALPSAQEGASRLTLEARSQLGGQDQVVVDLEVSPLGILGSIEPAHQEARYGEEVCWTFRFAKESPQLDDRRLGSQFFTSGLAALRPNHRELNGVVEFFRGTSEVWEREYCTTLQGRAGTHDFEINLIPLGRQDSISHARASVTLVDDQGLSLEADPPTWQYVRSTQQTFHLLVTNDSDVPRRVELRHCCGFLVTPSYDNEPIWLAPGASRRVPVQLQLNDIVGPEAALDFTARDADDNDIQTTTQVPIENVRFARLLMRSEPSQVAQGGEASFQLQLQRSYPDWEPCCGEVRVQVHSPVGWEVEQSFEVVDLSQDPRYHTLDVTLRNLRGLAPGPWPVRFAVTPVDAEAPLFEVFGEVIIPPGDVVGAFDPAELLLPGPGQARAQLMMDNQDFGQARGVRVSLVSSPEGLSAAPAALELALEPGARGVTEEVLISAPAPGLYTLRALLDAGQPTPEEALLQVRVLDPAQAPSILSLTLNPMVVAEGDTALLEVLASDPTGDPLSYDFDLDQDGLFEIQGAVQPQASISFVDDGQFVVRAAAQDPEGGRDEASLTVTVSNVAPSIQGEPPGQALEGQLYLYQPSVSDPGQDTVTLTLTESPEGAQLVDGVLRWTPSLPQVGEVALALEARDEDGGVSTQRWTVQVAEANLRPGAPTFVSPEEEEQVTRRPVRLAWTRAQDPEGDALTYTLELSTQEDFGDPVIQAEGLTPEAPEDQELAYEATLEELPPAPAYYARVRAVDGRGPGPWGQRRFSVPNLAPPAPAQLMPVDGAMVEPGPVPLSFAYVEDPDGQPVRYEVIVYRDAALTEEAWRASALEPLDGQAQGEASFEAPAEAALWYWTVAATDSQGLQGEVAGPEEFAVLLEPVNQAPSAPVLVSPLEGAQVEPGAVPLVLWQGEDPDGDAVTHEITLWDEGDQQVTALVGLSLGDQTPATVEVSLEQPGLYRWQARATDARGLEGEPSQTGTFEVVAMVEPEPDEMEPDVMEPDAMEPDMTEPDLAREDMGGPDLVEDQGPGDLAEPDQPEDDLREDFASQGDATGEDEVAQPPVGVGSPEGGCDCASVPRRPRRGAWPLLWALCLGLWWWRRRT